MACIFQLQKSHRISQRWWKSKELQLKEQPRQGHHFVNSAMVLASVPTIQQIVRWFRKLLMIHSVHKCSYNIIFMKTKTNKNWYIFKDMRIGIAHQRPVVHHLIIHAKYKIAVKVHSCHRLCMFLLHVLVFKILFLKTVWERIFYELRPHSSNYGQS